MQTVQPGAQQKVSGSNPAATTAFGGVPLVGQSPAVNGDTRVFDVYLEAGPWTLDFQYGRSAAGGKVDIEVNGVVALTVDTYDAAGGDVRTATIGPIVMPAGLNVIRLVVNGKNASSAGYFSYIGAMGFTPD